MQFHLGALPDDFEPDEHWRSIVEPSPMLMQIVALPIAFGAGLLFFSAWHLLIEFETPHIPRVGTWLGRLPSSLRSRY